MDPIKQFIVQKKELYSDELRRLRAEVISQSPSRIGVGRGAGVFSFLLIFPIKYKQANRKRTQVVRTQKDG